MRTRQEIINLANIIRNHADDICIDDTEGCGIVDTRDTDSVDLKNEMTDLYRDLHRVAAGDEPENTEVRRWVNNDPSDLDIYLN